MTVVTLRGWLWERVLPTMAVLGVVLACNVLAMTVLFSRGYSFGLTPVGTAISLALTGLIGLACHGVLRWKGLQQTGFRLDVVGLVLATAAGLALPGVLVAVLVAVGGGSLAGTVTPRAALVVVPFVLNAAFQQVGLQALGVAATDRGRLSVGAWVGTVALFVASHAAVSTAPVYVVNVALFAVATSALFWARRSVAAPAGLHGGWNAALYLMDGLGEPGTSVTWTPADDLWTGGAAGLESGVAYTILVGTVAAAAVIAASRAPRQLGRQAMAATSKTAGAPA